MKTELDLKVHVFNVIAHDDFDCNQTYCIEEITAEILVNGSVEEFFELEPCKQRARLEEARDKLNEQLNAFDQLLEGWVAEVQGREDLAVSEKLARRVIREAKDGCVDLDVTHAELYAALEAKLNIREELVTSWVIEARGSLNVPEALLQEVVAEAREAYEDDEGITHIQMYNTLEAKREERS